MPWPAMSSRRDHRHAWSQQAPKRVKIVLPTSKTVKNVMEAVRAVWVRYEDKGDDAGVHQVKRFWQTYAESKSKGYLLGVIQGGCSQSKANDMECLSLLRVNPDWGTADDRAALLALADAARRSNLRGIDTPLDQPLDAFLPVMACALANCRKVSCSNLKSKSRAERGGMSIGVDQHRELLKEASLLNLLFEKLEQARDVSDDVEFCRILRHVYITYFDTASESLSSITEAIVNAKTRGGGTQEAKVDKKTLIAHRRREAQSAVEEHVAQFENKTVLTGDGSGREGGLQQVKTSNAVPMVDESESEMEGGSGTEEVEESESEKEGGGTEEVEESESEMEDNDRLLSSASSASPSLSRAPKTTNTEEIDAASDQELLTPPTSNKAANPKGGVQATKRKRSGSKATKHKRSRFEITIKPKSGRSKVTGQTKAPTKRKAADVEEEQGGDEDEAQGGDEVLLLLVPVKGVKRVKITRY